MAALALVLGVGGRALYSQNQDSGLSLKIQVIESAKLTDLIALNGRLNLNQGIERGMLLSVFRDGLEIGELLVSRVKENCSAALIKKTNPEEVFAVGDRAAIEVRTF